MRNKLTEVSLEGLDLVFARLVSVSALRPRRLATEHTRGIADVPSTHSSGAQAAGPPKGPGYIVCYEIERVSGVGPWVPNRP